MNLTLISDLVSGIRIVYRVWYISSILLEVGILHFVCGCILGWQSVEYRFGVTVTLTFGQFSRIIVSGSHLLYYFR